MIWWAIAISTALGIAWAVAEWRKPFTITLDPRRDIQR